MNTLYYRDNLKILREYIKYETVLLKDVHGLESVGTRTPSSACSESLTLADGGVRVPQYRIIGEPEDLDGARQLASEDRYKFQWWALSLIKARPLGGNDKDNTVKRGADKGIDGTITFIDDNTMFRIDFEEKREATRVSSLRAFRAMFANVEVLCPNANVR